MAWQSPPYTIPLVLAAGIAVTMFVLALTQRGRKGATTMMALFGAMSLYAGGYAMQLATVELNLKLFFYAVQILGPAFVTLAFLVFSLQYTDRNSVVTGRFVAVVAVIPVATTVLVWTDVYGFHDLVLASATVETVAGMEQLVETPGPWYLVHAGYAILLTLVAIGLFTEHSIHSDGPDRKRSAIFALSGVIPLAGTFAHVAGYTVIDWGPVTYVVTGLMLVFAIFYF